MGVTFGSSLSPCPLLGEVNGQKAVNASFSPKIYKNNRRKRGKFTNNWFIG